MKYTYQISFNGSDYNTLYPNNDITMEGGWEQGTMIWREKISELKITKALNDTIYDTLETWFEDKTYFETRIFVKVLKNSVQDSLHWFGIKWGKLDKHLNTYNVEPSVYDIWGQYFESQKDYEQLFTGLGHAYSYYDDTWPYVFTAVNNKPVIIHNVVKKVFTSGTGWLSADIVSSLFNNDDFEDSTSIPLYNGMESDYVTGKESYLLECGLLTKNKHTIKELLDWFKLFRVYFWIDDNNDLRYEHISYLNDKLIDNAIDFSSYIEDYNDAWNYENTDIPSIEKISLGGFQESLNTDFIIQNIQYSNIRNRADITPVENSYSVITDIGAYSSDVINDDVVLFSALNNHVYELQNDDMDSFTADFNTFDLTWSVGQTCGSQDIHVSLADAFTVTVTPSSYTGLIRVFLEERSTGTPISNVVNIARPGGSTGTLTATASASDGRLVIEAHTDATGSAVGWITLTHPTGVIVPNIEGVISEDVVTNGAFSIGNIFEAYWQDDRLSRSGTFNDTVYNFTSTQYNLRRDTIKFHYSGDINPLYGFDDGTRIGKIDKWTRWLDTDFYEIDVIYQEDE